MVWYVAEMAPGVSDQDVLNLANHEQAVLVTADKDFGELVFRQHLLNPGVILLRLTGLLPTVKAEVLARAITAHMKEMGGQLCGSFSPGDSHTTIKNVKPFVWLRSNNSFNSDWLLRWRSEASRLS